MRSETAPLEKFQVSFGNLAYGLVYEGCCVNFSVSSDIQHSPRAGWPFILTFSKGTLCMEDVYWWDTHSLSDNEQNDFYPVACWLLCVLSAWRTCGKAGKYFTSHPKTQKHTISTETRDQGLPDSKKQNKKTGSLFPVSTRGLCQKRPPPPDVFSLPSFP